MVPDHTYLLADQDRVFGALAGDAAVEEELRWLWQRYLELSAIDAARPPSDVNYSPAPVPHRCNGVSRWTRENGQVVRRVLLAMPVPDDAPATQQNRFRIFDDVAPGQPYAT